MGKRLVYFQFYIDDYMRDCEELSIAQHGAYLRLMLWYYSIGKPIPANDPHRIYNRCGAKSFEEQRSVDFVLTEYFQLDKTVWRHKRIDDEISAFHEKSEKAKHSANVRWGRNNDFVNNEPTYANAMPTQSERNANQNHKKNNVELVRSSAVLIETDSHHSYSAERSKTALRTEASPAVISITLNDKTEFAITQSQIDEWDKLFPSVDVLQTLNEIRAWNLANPKRNKTKTGVLRHVVAWLSKEQNHG